MILMQQKSELKLLSTEQEGQKSSLSPLLYRTAMKRRQAPTDT